MPNLNNGGLTRVLNYIKTWVNGLLSGKSDTSHTHTKNQITDFPSIPSKTSQLTNDSGYLTSHQSLSNYVTLNSAQTISSNKTFNDRTIFKKGSYMHSFGSGQDVGYIKFATITIDAQYQDCTATLVIMNRSYYKPVYVYIKFNGTNNVDPNINFFATDATNNNANDYYLVKSATSTWDLYVYKTAWNTFCVLDFWQSQNNTEHVTFTWKAEFVSSLPSGNIKATFSAYNYNDLSNKPTIPTVNNKTLTIQKNGTTVNTFTANSSTDITANITVPTKVSELTNDSGYITSSGSCNYANYSGYVQGTRTFSTYVNAVKYGNSFVSSNQTGFSTIWNAPTKNYRVGCAVYPNSNDDVYLCYSVSNANVNSSTNTVTKDCVWNAGDGTLRSANIKATSGLYYNSYKIYVG